MTKQKLTLHQTSDEGRLQGTRKDGKIYSVREHRMSWLLPDAAEKVMKALKSKRAKLTFQLLLQTGARINEIRFIEERDIDYERNTLRLRVTKTKAKKGETKGKPRTIPISSKFAKELKKYFREVGE